MMKCDSILLHVIGFANIMEETHRRENLAMMKLTKESATYVV